MKVSKVFGAKMPKEEKRKFWQPMIDHIDSTWRKVKGSQEYGYPFTGKDMKDLRQATRIFKEWGIMALWDEYLANADDYVKKAGYDIFTFLRQIPRLVDKPHWKAKAKQYEDKLVGPIPKEIIELLPGLTLHKAK